MVIPSMKNLQNKMTYISGRQIFLRWLNLEVTAKCEYVIL